MPTSKNAVVTSQKEVERQQMDLFAHTDIGTPAYIPEFSNSILPLEGSPRFLRGSCKSYRVSEAPDEIVVTNEYMSGGHRYLCSIKPAMIPRKENGKTVNYFVYPSDREELVERTLFAIASNNGLIKRSLPNSAPRYGVEFSIYEIRELLISIGKTKPYDDIREALLVLRDNVTTIRAANSDSGVELKTQVYSDSLLDVKGKGRSRERCFVMFNDFVVEQIKQLNYRQYSYKSIHTHTLSMGTYLHNFLCNNWLNCNEGATYTIDAVVLCQSYGKGHVSADTRTRMIRDGLKSMASHDLITHVPRLKDGCYQITATAKLEQEVRTANAKRRGIGTLSEGIENGTIRQLPPRRVYG